MVRIFYPTPFLLFYQMVWPVSTRVRAVQLLWQLGSAAEARRALARELGRRKAPPAQTITRWSRVLEETGSLLRPQDRRRPHRLTPATIRLLRQALQRSPRLSTRRLSARTGVPRTTVHRAIRHQLGLFPYKLQLVQRLHRGDKAKRLRFCHWLLSKWRLSSFRKGLLMTDEAHFHLDGSVVKQNCRVWGAEQPHEVAFRQGHSPHVTVWCGVASWGIVGPFFFEEGRKVVTVTGIRYCRMLEDYLLPQLEHYHVAQSRVWFQQDGARPHTAASTLTHLQRAFPGKVLSKGGSVEWPPRSPDLSLPDFFLWGHIKAEVYRSRVPSLAALKQRIRAAIHGLSQDTVKAAVDNLALRARACVRLRGGYLETVLPH